MRKNHWILLPAIAMLALTACDRGGEAEIDNETKPLTTDDVMPREVLVTDLAPLIGKEWRLTNLFGEAMPEDAGVTLKILPEDRVSGNAAVNRYNGPLRLVEGGIEVGPFAATRMAGPPEAMERERAYLAALGSAKSISTIGDEQLVIAVKDKELPLRFKAITQP